jgi:2-dehydropantoate 2-reductase
MSSADTIYVLGAGAIGLPLAAFLAGAGRSVVAVRTSRADVPRGTVTVTLRNGAERTSAPVETVSLERMGRLDGIVVVTAKAYANDAIARELASRAATGPVVLLQNGIGVEQPFLDAGVARLYRCVLYVTSQATAEHDYSVRAVAASPVGVVAGTEAELERCVTALDTASIPLRAEVNIEREVWKKAIINAVFNSVCPLLEADNGIFARDAVMADLARDLVRECVSLTDRLGLGLGEGELMEQLLLISRRSDGQLISTLQDIRAGRSTEIAFLNAAIARAASALQPNLSLPRVALLGQLVEARAAVLRASGGSFTPEQ